MDARIINGGGDFNNMMKAKIASAFTNTEEMLRTDEETSLIGEIQKGEVAVIGKDALEKEHNMEFFFGKDVRAFEKRVDDLVTKGEKDYLTQDEYEEMCKGLHDLKNITRKAIVLKGEKSGVTKYLDIFVKGEAYGQYPEFSLEEEEAK